MFKTSGRNYAEPSTIASLITLVTGLRQMVLSAIFASVTFNTAIFYDSPILLLWCVVFLLMIMNKMCATAHLWMWPFEKGPLCNFAELACLNQLFHNGNHKQPKRCLLIFFSYFLPNVTASALQNKNQRHRHENKENAVVLVVFFPGHC